MALLLTRSDVMAVLDQKTYRRPIYAGNIIATIKSTDSKQIITVRVTAFDPTPLGEATADLVKVDFIGKNQQSHYVASERHGGDRPELSVAEMVSGKCTKPAGNH